MLLKGFTTRWLSISSKLKYSSMFVIIPIIKTECDMFFLTGSRWDVSVLMEERASFVLSFVLSVERSEVEDKGEGNGGTQRCLTLEFRVFVPAGKYWPKIHEPVFVSSEDIYVHTGAVELHAFSLGGRDGSFFQLPVELEWLLKLWLVQM